MKSSITKSFLIKLSFFALFLIKLTQNFIISNPEELVDELFILNSKYPNYIKIDTAQSRYGIERNDQCDYSSSYDPITIKDTTINPCDNLIVLVSNFNKYSYDKPHIYISGAINGNKNGPVLLVEFLRYYIVSDIYKPFWVTNLLDKVVLVITPNTNAYGYINNKDKDLNQAKSADYDDEVINPLYDFIMNIPNDYADDIIPELKNSCLNTQTTKTISNLLLEFNFLASIILDFDDSSYITSIHSNPLDESFINIFTNQLYVSLGNYGSNYYEGSDSTKEILKMTEYDPLLSGMMSLNSENVRDCFLTYLKSNNIEINYNQFKSISLKLTLDNNLEIGLASDLSSLDFTSPPKSLTQLLGKALLTISDMISPQIYFKNYIITTNVLYFTLLGCRETYNIEIHRIFPEDEFEGYKYASSLRQFFKNETMLNNGTLVSTIKNIPCFWNRNKQLEISNVVDLTRHPDINTLEVDEYQYSYSMNFLNYIQSELFDILDDSNIIMLKAVMDCQVYEIEDYEEYIDNNNTDISNIYGNQTYINVNSFDNDTYKNEFVKEHSHLVNTRMVPNYNYTSNNYHTKGNNKVISNPIIVNKNTSYEIDSIDSLLFKPNDLKALFTLSTLEGFNFGEKLTYTIYSFFEIVYDSTNSQTSAWKYKLKLNIAIYTNNTNTDKPTVQLYAKDGDIVTPSILKDDSFTAVRLNILTDLSTNITTIEQKRDFSKTIENVCKYYDVEKYNIGTMIKYVSCDIFSESVNYDYIRNKLLSAYIFINLQEEGNHGVLSGVIALDNYQMKGKQVTSDSFCISSFYKYLTKFDKLDKGKEKYYYQLLDTDDDYYILINKLSNYEFNMNIYSNYDYSLISKIVVYSPFNNEEIVYTTEELIANTPKKLFLDNSNIGGKVVYVTIFKKTDTSTQVNRLDFNCVIIEQAYFDNESIKQFYESEFHTSGISKLALIFIIIGSVICFVGVSLFLCCLLRILRKNLPKRRFVTVSHVNQEKSYNNINGSTIVMERSNNLSIIDHRQVDIEL